MQGQAFIPTTQVSMSAYKKPYLTFQEQLELLKKRGLAVTDDRIAIKYLKNIGYYRLSGYWHPFIDPNEKDRFISGTKFEEAVDLYVFDKKLRLLVLDAIERIEVAIRVDIAYLLGSKDPFAHVNPLILHKKFTGKIGKNSNQTAYEKWLNSQNNCIERSREEFVLHHIDKYGLPLPIWITIELWDFGLLSTFFQGMKDQDKRLIAEKYQLPPWGIMENWLRCLNYLRNISAHHSRLWNKNLVNRPILKKRTMPLLDHLIHTPSSRLYSMLCILIYFLKIISPASSWKLRLVKLINEFPNSEFVSINSMGFPQEWKQYELWKL